MSELLEAERDWATPGAHGRRRRRARGDPPDEAHGILRSAAGRRAQARRRRRSARERHRLGLRPAYKTVDTCAGEFPSATPYLYSSYDEENEARAVGDRTVVILGSGPNRIGQGVEFDYCCVRAAIAFRELGYRTVMVNSNPETVSTDFDISDALYFEPLTLEDVLEIVAVEQPIGVVVQLGGQTPLRLARGLEREGVTDPRHVARGHRPGRGPRPVRGADAGAGRGPAAERDRALGGGGGGGGGAGGLSGARAPVVRARRAGDGDRVRRRLAAELLRARGAGRAGASGADRQLPRGCVRGGRRRHRRRQPVRDRRRHAAHRGRRHSLRRFGLRAAAVPHHRSAGGRDAPAHARLCRAARRGRPAERPVRHQARRGLRARGQSARVANGAVRLQDDRRAARGAGRRGHGGTDARRAGSAR